MYILYRNVNHPLCRIDKKLKVMALKGEVLSEKERHIINILLEQIKRGMDTAAGSLRCVDLVAKEATTLKELVGRAGTKKLDFLNPQHTKRIDRYRGAGLSEKQIAAEFETNEKMLYRHYPRYKSVDKSSTGRTI